MNISKQSRDLTHRIGKTIATMYAEKLPPLQIPILVEVRFLYSQLKRGKHLFTDTVRKEVEELFRGHGGEPPSKAGFWHTFNKLAEMKLIYIAPHQHGTSKRAITLTALGDDKFHYPRTIHPYKTQP